MREKPVYAVTAFLILLFAGSMVYSVEPASWDKRQVVEDVDPRFMDSEITGELFSIVYRNSTDSGVMVRSRKISSGLSLILNRVTSSGYSWRTETVSTSEGSGAYLSAAEIDGELSIAYQDASIGSEKVVYAHRQEGSWNTETVADVDSGGVNVGMYTSLTFYNGSPMVLYHSPVQGLKSALKSEGGWQKSRLGDGQGWFTDTASCGNRTFAVYRGRNSSAMKVSTYDGDWSTEEVNASIKSAVDISAGGCDLHTVYLSTGGKLNYRFESEESLIESSPYSGASIDVKNGEVHMSYYSYGNGTFYASKLGDSWKRTKLAGFENSSKYNDIEVDKAGNIHLVFLDGSDIVYAVKDSGTVEKAREIIRFLRLLLGALSIAAVSFSVQTRYEFVTGR